LKILSLGSSFDAQTGILLKRKTKTWLELEKQIQN
jgi:hypothetical protein